MNGKELKKILEKNDWICVRITGSHHIMEKEGKSFPIPIHGAKDIKIGTLNNILKLAGLK
jgi:predicted RNA binding protein YcfA (HicA-like mRNA interferase family)